VKRKIRQAFPKIYAFRRKGRNFEETLKGFGLAVFSWNRPLFNSLKKDFLC
jgi:hypothetical protein